MFIIYLIIYNLISILIHNIFAHKNFMFVYCPLLLESNNNLTNINVISEPIKKDNKKDLAFNQ